MSDPAEPPAPAIVPSASQSAPAPASASASAAELDRQARALRAKPTEDGLCKLARAALTLAQAVNEDAQRPHMQRPLPPEPLGLGTLGTLPDDEAAWFVDWEELASLAPQTHTARLFATVAPLLKPQETATPPPWLARDSDLTACVHFGDVSRQVAALHAAWSRAPACARAIVEPRMTTGFVAELTMSRCLCDGTEADVRQAITLLKRSPLNEVPRMAASLENTIAEGKTRFGCRQDTIDYTR